MNQSFRGGSLQKLLSESNNFVDQLLSEGYESMLPSKRYGGVKVSGKDEPLPYVAKRRFIKHMTIRKATSREIRIIPSIFFWD